MHRSSSHLFPIALVLALVPGLYPVASQAAGATDAVTSIIIRAPRDIGYFAGDLVKADVELVVAKDYTLETASLPHPGPLDYWLDLRSIDVEERMAGGVHHYTLHMLYQNFYDALDVRLQAIPGFAVSFRKEAQAISADVPAWTIGVSPLREVAPAPKDDPKDYMRADAPSPLVTVAAWWRAAAWTLFAALVATIALAYDRAWRPFRQRNARAFGKALRRVRAIDPADKGAYREALLCLHRGIDQTDGQRILADDLPGFLRRHPVFQPLASSLTHFFAASRQAFFGSDPARSPLELPFDQISQLARQLAAAERQAP